VIFEKLIVCYIYGFAFLFPICFFPYAEEIVRIPQEVLLHIFGIHIFIALILRKTERHLSSERKNSLTPNGLRTYLFLILGLNVLLLPSIFLSEEPIFSLYLYSNVFFGSVIA